jgi:N,N-dimethylformamidase
VGDNGAGSVFGYVDRLSVEPGDRLRLMVSSAEPVDFTVVRLVHGDPNPEGPGRKEEPQAWGGAGLLEPGVQPTFPGSCAVSDPVGASSDVAAWSIEVAFRLDLLEATSPQTVLGAVTASGQPIVALTVEADGGLRLYTGDAGARQPISEPSGRLLRRRWYHASVTVESTGAVSAVAEEVENPTGTHAIYRVESAERAISPAEMRGSRLVLGAACDPRGAREDPEAWCFNGRVADPILRIRTADGAEDETRWQLGDGIGHIRRPDVSDTCALTLVNAPTDGVRGPNWTGHCLHFEACRGEYGALAFHEDDLEDAGWEPTREIDVPDVCRSGAYAARLAAGDRVRYVAFFVVPPRKTTSKPSVAVILPTFTYMAYANEHMLEAGLEESGVFERPVVSRDDEDILQHREFGLSLYDCHRDGSGVCISSYRRPLINVSPDYRVWMDGAPRHLGADLYLIDWLEHFGYDYDVLTDHSVHAGGIDTLQGYRTVITGSHPEYTSEQELDAIDEYVKRGGKLMYLGGNGHYWVTSVDPERDHLIEIRRGHGGTRTWEAEPGEGYLASTGEPGGLWRHRDRPPNRLLGLGFTSQGWDVRAPGFRRVLPEGTDWEWIFDGVRSPESFGDTGLVMGGAAGDELDRFDVDRGSPEEAILLATSTGHSDFYQLVIEDLLMTVPNQGGSDQPLVRADVVVIPHEGGGMVFSAGAITWSGSLSWNGYDNDLSRVTRNVLDNFVRET